MRKQAALIVGLVLCLFNLNFTYAQSNSFCPAINQGFVKIDITAKDGVAGQALPVKVQIKNIYSNTVPSGNLIIRLRSNELIGADRQEMSKVIFERFATSTRSEIKPGETLVDEYQINLKPVLPAGRYYVEAIYLPAEGYSATGSFGEFDEYDENYTSAIIDIRNDIYKPLVYIDDATLHLKKNGDGYTMSVDIVNETDASKTVPVLINVHRNSALNRDSLLSGSIRNVTVPAKSSVPISYNLTDKRYAKYALEIQTIYEGIKSYSVHTVGLNSGKPTLYFSGVRDADSSIVLYGCVFTTLSKGQPAEQYLGKISVSINDTMNKSFDILNEGVTEYHLNVETRLPVFRVMTTIFDQHGDIISTDMKTYSCDNTNILCDRSVIKLFTQPIALYSLIGLLTVALIGIIYIKKRHNRVII